VSTKRLKDYRGISCLNCNHPLDISDKFCPNCGQKNTTKRLALRDFIDEFLANFYAYDSKVKHTIFSCCID
jgi:predicted amidophosphoribosyltransferase